MNDIDISKAILKTELYEISGKRFTNDQLTGFIDKYILFEPMKNDEVQMIFLDRSEGQAKSYKIGNIKINLKKCLIDIFELPMMLKEVDTNTKIQNILIVLKTIQLLVNAVGVSIDTEHGYILGLLHNMNAEKYEVSIDRICEEVYKNKDNDMDSHRINGILDDLSNIKCIEILNGKVKVKERIECDWIGLK